MIKKALAVCMSITLLLISFLQPDLTFVRSNRRTK